MTKDMTLMEMTGPSWLFFLTNRRTPREHQQWLACPVPSTAASLVSIGFHWFPLVSIFWFKSIGILFADSSFLSDFRSHLSAKWMPFLLMEPVWNPLKTTSEEPFLHRRSVRRLLAELGGTWCNFVEHGGTGGSSGFLDGEASKDFL